MIFSIMYSAADISGLFVRHFTMELQKLRVNVVLYYVVSFLITNVSLSSFQKIYSRLKALF